MPRKSRPVPAGPQWRTAPGLGSGSTALRDRPDELELDTRADDRDFAVPAPAPVLGRAPSTPFPVADDEPELARPQRRLDGELPRFRSDETAHHGTTAVHPTTPEPVPDDRRALARRPSMRESFARSVRSLEPISDLEAAAFAGRFAADFQSFDEDDPSHRATVLRPLLADPQASTWGWSGHGRQRAESPLPGRLFRSSDTVVFVEVLVRATTYARGRAASEPDVPAGKYDEPVGIVGPSSVPPESDPRWVAVEANWLRMTVPITRSPDDGRLVVDPLLVPEQTA